MSSTTFSPPTDRATAEKATTKRGRRPRVKNSPARERVEVRVTTAELQDLKDVARENGSSLAALLRDALNEFVADYRERLVFVR